MARQIMLAGSRRSKHATPPDQGACNLGVYSTLRKRMRAARRGLTWVYEPSPKELLRHRWYRDRIKQQELALS